MKKLNIFYFIIVFLFSSCNENSKSRTRLHVIFDNLQPHLMPVSLFENVPDSLIHELDIANGIPSSMSVILIEKDGYKLLFDTGNGNKDSQLIPYLNENGISPNDIDAIFITHLHRDHIGGLIMNGNKVFKNAKLYINSQELNSMTANSDKVSDDITTIVNAYGENLISYNISDKLPYDVKAIPAYGHTPGHTLYRLDDMLIVGDIMHGLTLQLSNPDYCARFDMDYIQAIESRKNIIELVKKEGWKMYGMHFPTKEGIILK